MATITLELPPSGLTPVEEAQVAAGINAVFETMGYPAEPLPLAIWWTMPQVEELGGRTVARAWLDGDHDSVRRHIEELVERSRQAAKRLAADPERMAALRERINRQLR